MLDQPCAIALPTYAFFSERVACDPCPCQCHTSLPSPLYIPYISLLWLLLRPCCLYAQVTVAFALRVRGYSDLYVALHGGRASPRGFYSI